jgi:hypothetical protein
MARCRHDAPALGEARPKHWIACHLHEAGVTLPLTKPVAPSIQALNKTDNIIPAKAVIQGTQGRSGCPGPPLSR